MEERIEGCGILWDRAMSIVYTTTGPEVKRQLHVLMLNDTPIGLYSNKELADRAAEQHRAEFFKGQNPGAGFYRVCPFVIDGPARL